MEDLQGKKVLVMGLGAFGGGAFSTNWLLAQGAHVTVTDLKGERELARSLKKIKDIKKVKLVLGKHRPKDFVEHDIIVVGPAVPRGSDFLKIAQRNKKRLENDTSLFFRYITRPVIAVTGTRGKTTTTNFIAQLLSKGHRTIAPCGNTPENPLLREIGKRVDASCPAVAELSSWQLEFLPVARRAPHIAIITNLYPDHLNRHKNITEYARAKANIFRYQKKDDILILNYDNKWTRFFLSKKSKSQLYFFSRKKLPQALSGIYCKGDMLIYRSKGVERKLVKSKDFARERGEHNLDNLMAALLAAVLFDPTFVVTPAKLRELKGVPLRQEAVFDDGKMMIINDSAATSPDAVVQAIERFRNKNMVLITGGTDKDLDFTPLAREIKKYVPHERLIFLAGSATEKFVRSLFAVRYYNAKTKPQLYETLRACVEEATNIIVEKRGVIVFSPGAASFEKFKNEFDRGATFNRLVKRTLSRREG